MLSKDDEREGLVAVARKALEQFCELTGLIPETVSGARPEGEGWSFLVDVVELERFPQTVSVIASYRLDTDRRGELVAYERVRRFTRVTTD